MNDTQDDPLLGLLTDIAEGVAALAARVDEMKTEAAAHRAQVNEALTTPAIMIWSGSDGVICGKACAKKWCGRTESNQHSFRSRILNCF